MKIEEKNENENVDICPSTLPSSSSSLSSSSSFDLSRLNDHHCLLTGRAFDHPQQTIRCGRCCGSFHLDALFEMANTHSSPSSSSMPSSTSITASGSTAVSGSVGGSKGDYADILPFIILPGKDQLELQSHDEWFCPFCLQEDTSAYTHTYVCTS